MVEITMYGLTTCPHCKRTLEFLKKNGVEFDTVWLDDLKGEDKKKAVEKIYNISGSYSVPLIVKGDKFVLGFDEEKIRELIK